MPISSKKKTIKEDGHDKDALVVSFTNGAMQQIEELQHFIGAEDPLDVIKLGISFVQRAKEVNESKNADNADTKNPS